MVGGGAICSLHI
ncbi:hypothetical protein ELR70_02120 [Pseudoalteromonas sp. R3]|nr:hypothetical protein ELR70_02120 [Pseudoalteromonas sp. R3]